MVEEEGFERIDAIKLDVEGAEDIVLAPFLAEAPERLYPGLLIVENGAARWQIDLPAPARPARLPPHRADSAEPRLRPRRGTAGRHPVSDEPVTAAILVIGDEILSGRTKDKNIGYMAEYLTRSGIDVREVRVVPDVEGDIVAAVNGLRARYTYLFTTGGIGPTHDDITADCVARAFGVSIDVDPAAVDMLLMRIKREDLNEARLRMARIPAGARPDREPDLASSRLSARERDRDGGVPAIMQAMLDNVVPTLTKGLPVTARTVEATGLPEGLYAAGLAAIAARHPDISIGSYPSYSPGGFTNQIIARGRDLAVLDGVVAANRGDAGRTADRLKRGEGGSHRTISTCVGSLRCRH